MAGHAPTTSLFHVVGYFRDDAEPRRAELHERYNEHLRQAYPRVHLAGSLRGPEGERTGVMILLEARSLEDAQAFLAESPYQKAGLYQHFHVERVEFEVGRLD